MNQVTAEEIELCYGTKRIKNKQDQCRRRAQCPWGEACLSRANEEPANIHYHKANISVGFMLFNPLETAKNNSEDALIEKEACTIAENGSDTNERVFFDNFSFTQEQHDAACIVIERLADLYFNKPTVFEMLLKHIYRNYNQSDLAREKKITRAGINKRLLSEIGVAQKRNDIQQRRDRELAKAKQEYADKIEALKHKDEFLSNLSTQEWIIYKLAFVDGCSNQSIARQLNISVATVKKAVQYIHANLNNNASK